MFSKKISCAMESILADGWDEDDVIIRYRIEHVRGRTMYWKKKAIVDEMRERGYDTHTSAFHTEWKRGWRGCYIPVNFETLSFD